VIKLFFARNLYDEIFYFDISKAGKVVLKCLGLDQHLRPFDFKLSELEDETGETLFVRIYRRDLYNVYKDIRSELCENNQLIADFAKRFDKEKTESYFMKYFLREFNKDIIIYINVIDRYRKKKCESLQSVIEFTIEFNSCIKILKLFALREYNIHLRSYVSIRSLHRIIRDIFGNLYLSIVAFIKPFMYYGNFYNASSNKEDTVRDSLVATYYNPGGLTFDITKRCDFFWLLNSTIPYERCLIYFERTDTPATNEMVNVLRSHGVNFIALSKKATTTKAMPVYKPSSELTKMMINLMLKTLLCVFKDVLRFKFKSLKCISGALYFNRKFALAYDFFYSMSIKVNVDSGDFSVKHIPSCLALEALGGVSVSFQRSNIPFPQMSLSSFADVYFLFGNHYLPLIKKMGNKNHTVVICGYVTDYAIEAVKEKSKLLRKELMVKGAEFIICYFDEGSSDDRISIIPNRRSCDIYKSLLELVMTDKTIGLICSPKRPRTLRSRMPELNKIIEEAESTGRCIILDGSYFADNYPTEAAQASDVVITLLLGGTTFLESVLSGVRTVLLDLEGLYSYDEYIWGKETVVFDNLNNLLAAIKKYRRCPLAFEEFGDSRIIQTIKSKDSFRDGRASERIGIYIKWLIEKFNEDTTRDEVLAYARQNYVKAWGPENIY